MTQRLLTLKLNSSKSAIFFVPIILLLTTLGVLIYNSRQFFTFDQLLNSLNGDLAFYILVGLAAQLVDGTLGMAYGITSTSS